MAGAMKREWKFNCWTGNYTCQVNNNGRIVRMAGGGLYWAEHWGDYSLSFPVRGDTRKSFGAAKRDLEHLQGVAS